MDVWNQLPFAGQLALLTLVGAVVGGQINRGIYRLAWHPRSISPWSAPPPGAGPRPGWSLVPIVGWWTLRAESAHHGRGFWMRPLLIELTVAVLYPTLYQWVLAGGLLPHAIGVVPPEDITLQAQFLVLAGLLPLLIVATFIDFDEQTIPDEITVTGTLVGLLLAATIPAGGLPIAIPGPLKSLSELDALNLTSPTPWETWLDGPSGLWIGLGCFGGWCLAIAHWVWTTRRGWRKAFLFLFASLVRRDLRRRVAMLVVGAAAISFCWWVGGWHWRSLLSSLVGIAFGGGLVWLVRILASRALGEEAMGFGDVTLMSMIGAFLGWQPSLLVFSMAPAAAVFVSIAQWLFTGRRDIAFGPYLCVAAVAVVFKWGELWHGWAANFFSLGLFVPAVLLVCLVLMAGLLLIWGQIKRRLFVD